MEKPFPPELTPELLEAISNSISAKSEKPNDKKQSNYSSSIPAKAGTHEWRKKEEAQSLELTSELLEAISNKYGPPAELPWQSIKSSSIPAKAGTHGWRKMEEPQTSPMLMRPTRGNPTIQIPPLYYNPQEQTGWVYIVANRPNGMIYIGQTTNLPRRITEHKDGKIEGFSKKHKCNMLVYFEGFSLVTDSIEKETRMKDWKRAWKIRRIIETNPTWRDLYTEICQTS